MTTQELSVRVPKKNDFRRFSIIKFNNADHVDPSEFRPESQVCLEREDNRGVVMSTQAVQEYGEGSEYGKAAREEARRKKYGRQARNYHLDNQPWRLTFTEADNRERKMNSIREGDGHSDNWLFIKEGDCFMAYKVNDMHRFVPAITHKTLDIEQAEEKYLQRNKVMNQFALKAQIMNQLKNEEDGEQVEGKTKNLKIKDEYSSNESGNDEDEDKQDTEKKTKKKKKKNEKPKKDKRQRVENGDEVAKYESSDGEDEGREYDYMSDSGSDSDRGELQVEEKIDKELVGVGDESGLKKMIGSDDESESDEEDFTKKLLNREEKKKGNIDVEERDSSGSDSDADPDKEKIDHVVSNYDMHQSMDQPESSMSAAKKRPATDDAMGGEAKKPKTESAPEGLNEETVRKYLRRKPHTTKELLAKFKNKCGEMTKPEIVTSLAAILRDIKPHQFKQKQGKKEVLFFSLNNNIT